MLEYNWGEMRYWISQTRTERETGKFDDVNCFGTGK